MSDKDRNDKPGPHGEGNYEATRQYNEGLKDHLRKSDTEQEARDAAPRSPAEAKELLEAEAQAKSKSRGEDAPKPGQGPDDKPVRPGG